MPEKIDSNFRRGDVLRADWANSVEDRLARLEGIRREGGGPGGDKFIGVAGDDFLPRSGSTVSGGPVTVYWLVSSTGTTGTIATSGVEIPLAWNVSDNETTSGSGVSILSGQYVSVMRDAFETWWCAPLECVPPAEEPPP